MPNVNISQEVWNNLVAIAGKQKREPAAVAQDVLRAFIEHCTDEELLERSCAAARRTPFRIEETEAVVRRHRLDPPDALPDGVVVRSEVVPSEPEGPLLDEAGQTLGDKLMKFAGRAVGLLDDATRNHGHYLCGAPKQ